VSITRSPKRGTLSAHHVHVTPADSVDMMKEVKKMKETDESVMVLLRHGVPLSLLADLVDPGGPRSLEIYESELATSSAA
jgi:hypothetical protein